MKTAQKTEANAARESNRRYLEDKVEELIDRGWSAIMERKLEPQFVMETAKRVIDMSRKGGYEAGEAHGLHLKSSALMFMSQYEEALKLGWNAFEIFDVLDDDVGRARAYTSMGMSYHNMGDESKSLDFLFRSLKIYESNDYEDFLTPFTYYCIGLVHFDRQDYDVALEYYDKCQADYERLELDFGLARIINNIGAIHFAKGELDEAREKVEESLRRFHRIDNELGVARAYNDLGRIAHAEGKRDAARAWYERGLQIRRQAQYPQGVLTSLLDLANFYLENRAYDEAESFLKEARELCERINAKKKRIEMLRLTSLLHKARRQYFEALEAHTQYHEAQQQYQRENSHNQIKQLQATYEIEKSAREKEVYRLKNIELADLNQELERALEMISDSINYARRIQEVILPSNGLMDAVFCDAFIFYRPRDVVSGDFYWLARVNDKAVFAVVDCTGHGVPGAFMSLLGYSLLNSVVKEQKVTDPSEILRQTDEALTRVLRQRCDTPDLLDGMDIAVATLDPKAQKLAYAGANLPLYMVLDGKFEEFAPSRAPLGGSTRFFKEKIFETKTVSYAKGDKFYMFSDGFKDQFGGSPDRARKYSTRRFQELIARIGGEEMPRQLELVESEFERWKGERKQIDDVIVAGIRL